jgi:Glyoxalase-like domain
MSQMRMAISLDCDDPGPLSTFWAEMLGGEITVTAKNNHVVTVDRRLLLVAMRVENYVRPTWPEGPVPKQVHIDLDVDDLPQAEKRALSLGAVRAETQPAPEHVLVLFDPAGHPFCLTTAFPK